jgi:hypothetical protein
MTTRRGKRSTAREHGSALVIVLMMVSLLAALGLSVALSSMTEARISGGFAAAVDLLYAADAAAERVMGELLLLGDWNHVLNGTLVSWATDGPPGVRLLADGERLDLRTVDVAEPGPWGNNVPQWRLFLSAPLARIFPTDWPMQRAYVAVWVGDDAAETDGNPAVDANETILLVAHAYGAYGSRRALEVTIARAHAPESEGGGPIGIRILSWREIH